MSGMQGSAGCGGGRGRTGVQEQGEGVWGGRRKRDSVLVVLSI